MEAVVPFLLTLLVLPPLGFLTVKFISMMVTKDLEVIPGLAGLAASFGVFGLSIWVGSIGFTFFVLVVVIGLIVFSPYAGQQMARAEFHQIDVDALDRSFQVIAQRPDSIPSYFDICRRLYDLGYDGPAIAIGERTLNGISTAMDPLRNASLRDQFRNEETSIKRWRRELKNPKAFDPVVCPLCSRPNDPSNLACEGCGRAHLLELARSTNLKNRTFGRLVLAFAMVCVFVVGGAAALMRLPSPFGPILFVAGLGATGVCLWLLFRGEVRSYDNLVS